MESTLLVGLVVGIVEVLKRAGLLDSKYAPLAALVVGVSLSALSGLTVDNAVAGLVAALVASGLYDNAAKTYGIVKRE